MKKLFCLLLVFNCLCARAFYPIVKNYELPAGIGKSNYDISQAIGGCMLFANEKGFLEFDGYEWELFENTSPIYTLYNNREQMRVYAGMVGNFGYYEFIPEEGIRFTSLKQYFRESGSIEAIREIIHIGNSLYLQDTRCIFKYDMQTNKVTKFDFEERIQCTAAVGNELWVVLSSLGVIILDDGVCRELPGIECLKDEKISCIVPDINGKSFICAEEGINIYENGKVTSTNYLKYMPHITCADYKNGKLAIGTRISGVNIIDLANCTIESVNSLVGLQDDMVLSVKFDAEDNLWITTKKGISYAKLNYYEQQFVEPNLFGSGYCSSYFDDKLYLGFDIGLFCVEMKEISKPIWNSMLKREISNSQIWSLQQLDGKLFCCHAKGITVIEEGGKYFEISIPGVYNVVRVPYNDNLLIGCSYDKYFVLEKTDGIWHFRNYIEGSNLVSHKFYVDYNSYLVVNSEWYGVNRMKLNEEHDEFTSSQHIGKLQGFPTDEDFELIPYQNKILYSTPKGFFSLDNGKAVPFNEFNSYFNGTPGSMKLWVSSIGEDKIFTSDKKIYLIHKYNNTEYVDSLSLLTLRDNLVKDFERYLSIDENTILVNTEDGFTVIDTKKLRGSIKPDNRNVFLKNLICEYDGRDSVLFSSRNLKGHEYRRMVLPSKFNTLKFKFGCTDYAKLDAIRFSYKLDGYDKDWSGLTDINQTVYHSLKPGEYVFHVHMTDGIESHDIEATYPFIIRSPWYLTIYAFVFYIGLILLLTWFLMLHFERVANKKADAIKLEKEQEIIALKAESLEQSMKHMSDDITVSTMRLIKKNELLQNINQDLDSVKNMLMKGYGKDEICDNIEGIRDTINQTLSGDESWRRFEQNFNILYKGFLNKLSEAYPQLTSGELKMCAYIKMGLSSKEIAPLTNIEVRSVEMSRHRIRKKMGLSRDENLSDFIKNFTF